MGVDPERVKMSEKILKTGIRRWAQQTEAFERGGRDDWITRRVNSIPGAWVEDRGPMVEEQKSWEANEEEKKEAEAEKEKEMGLWDWIQGWARGLRWAVGAA